MALHSFFHRLRRSDSRSSIASADAAPPLQPGSDVLAINRLNLQHFLWTKVAGYTLHPSIPLHPHMNIADVGTGTGIWLLDLSDSLPSASFTGFDTDLSQAPPEALRPDNVAFTHLDIFQPVPPAHLARFDIVHARLFMFVVKNGNPRTLARNLCALLKPGGYIHWSELDLTTRTFLGATAALQQANAHFHSFDPHFTSHAWIATLDAHLAAAGMTRIHCDRRTVADQTTDPRTKKWTHFRSLVAFQLYRVVAEQMPTPAMRDELLGVLGPAEREILQGHGPLADHVTWVAQKSIGSTD